MSQALLGLPLIVLLAWLTSSNRRRFPLRLVIAGLLAQLLLASLLLKVPALQNALMLINQLVLMLEAATQQGTAMVFGFLGGGPSPFQITEPQQSFVLAFRALPIVIVFAALSALLWHWRIIPLIISVLARLLQKSLGLSGAISIGGASSVFVGMVESPLLIKPHLRTMSNSELFMLMSCGMATVAGTVLGLYAGILGSTIPAALSHILVASLISAPAAILLAAVMVPPDRTTPAPSVSLTSPYGGSMDALVRGTGEGLRLLANIIGMLIVFVALVYLADRALSVVPVSGEPLTLVGVFGQILAPLAWLTGIPWHEARTAGELLATKVFINELVALLDLAALEPGDLSARSRLIMTYALCGFANFGSLGIMIGGLTAMCPERTADILRLAPRSIWSGLLATCMTACFVALIL
ncbi:NupC/NupG family nucleoside CNT transporter [Candidatus Marimicrobium litorale]|uniref:Nucleoside:proton symporter n=1 Tax=Candidatus Marimicrobium litorale TaxID=2518991 RepID=A0ABT3T0V3_9GAMM|nr:nucleoside transporter C-terminal domain-containing protein [Candidatus Marimicrobium litorale]MCX2975879.1 nucleoside:proton symporter [Candidatus Marimicrobium litorale]